MAVEAAGRVPAAFSATFGPLFGSRRLPVGSTPNAEIVREIEAGSGTEGGLNAKTGANGLNHGIYDQTESSSTPAASTT
jgi:hypothetical protein